MCTFKIIIFFTILESIYAYPLNIDEIGIDKMRESDKDNVTEMDAPTEKTIQQIYYEYYKDVKKNNNYFHLINPSAHQSFQYVYNPASSMAHSDPASYIPQGSSNFETYLPLNSNKHKNSIKFFKKYINFDEFNLRPLRSTKKNNEEFNLNSLEFMANIRREPHRQRVKNIREHFKKYMQHFMNKKNSKTRHNFEPYQPAKDMMLFKVQDSDGFLNKHNQKNENRDLKFLHIIEGNELLRNSEDTDYRFHIAYTDS